VRDICKKKYGLAYYVPRHLICKILEYVDCKYFLNYIFANKTILNNTNWDYLPKIVVPYYFCKGPYIDRTFLDIHNPVCNIIECSEKRKKCNDYLNRCKFVSSVWLIGYLTDEDLEKEWDTCGWHCRLFFSDGTVLTIGEGSDAPRDYDSLSIYWNFDDMSWLVNDIVLLDIPMETVQFGNCDMDEYIAFKNGLKIYKIEICDCADWNSENCDCDFDGCHCDCDEREVDFDCLEVECEDDCMPFFDWLDMGVKDNGFYRFYH
tara:strand:- start:362 stop:1147 length:786 start_codon:yes stop_codon:yes gene_type:complete